MSSPASQSFPMPAANASASTNPYKQPAFVAAVVVLLLAAVCLNGAVAHLQLNFKKLRVPLAMPLKDIPPRMGDWMQISIDKPLDPDIQEVLGTPDYVFRDFINVPADNGNAVGLMISALYPKDQAKGQEEENKYLAASLADRPGILQAELKDKNGEFRETAIYTAQNKYHEAVINMAVTYYTGLVDTVAHIPDRCYIADGFQPTDYIFPTWTLSNGRKLDVRFINFQDQNGDQNVDKNVAYFFHCNGRFESNPLAVRSSLQNLFVKYGYYAKVELMTMDADQARSAQTMTNFLSSALPEVEKTFPDWDKLTSPSAK